MSTEIVGRSPSTLRALQLVDRFAPSTLPILLVGATGTGKEVFAQRVHEASGRTGPLVAVSCAELPREMAESLLFGHRRGAFTGAVEAASGLVEAARGGTLFLDELLSLDALAQAQLLRVLESQEVRRLGETRSCRVDFRVVTAAQEDVQSRVHARSLRRDLYERVAGVVVDLAPLAVRPEDIMPLAEHFAAQRSQTLEPGAVAVLLNYSWPGNVRELRTAIERAGWLVPDGTLSPAAIAEAIALGGHTPADPSATVEGAERERLLAVCAAHSWDARRVADALGIHRATLYRWLRRSGISLRESQRSRVSRHLPPPCATARPGGAL